MNNPKRTPTLSGGLSLTLFVGDIFKITSSDGSTALVEYVSKRSASQIRIKIVAEQSIKISDVYHRGKNEKTPA